MFVRGGVYRVVKEAMGGNLAKLSVSALLFDYVLTGPISAVSAGLYLSGFLTDTFHHLGYNITVPDNAFAAGFRHRRHSLLLVEEHPGHSRVQRTCVADHEDHYRDGGGSHRLVPDHSVQASCASASASVGCHHASRQGIAGLAFPHLGGAHSLDHAAGRLWPFRSCHERRGIPGPDQSRDRTSQAEEPGKDRAGDLPLQPAFHLAGFVLRGDDHSRRGTA